MNYGINIFERLTASLLVADISFQQLCCRREIGWMPLRVNLRVEIVQYTDLMAKSQKPIDKKLSNKPSPTCNKNPHHIPLLKRCIPLAEERPSQRFLCCTGKARLVLVSILSCTILGRARRDSDFLGSHGPDAYNALFLFAQDVPLAEQNAP